MLSFSANARQDTCEQEGTICDSAKVILLFEHSLAINCNSSAVLSLLI
jgi:hypothetical protein